MSHGLSNAQRRVEAEGWDFREKPIRRLTDSELSKFASDVPTCEAGAVRAILGTHINPLRGLEYARLQIHREIEDRSLCYETQQILWLGLEQMQRFSPPESAPFTQISLF